MERRTMSCRLKFLHVVAIARHTHVMAVSLASLLCSGLVTGAVSDDLLEYEKNTIQVYEKAKRSVVYIECSRSLKGYSRSGGVQIPEGGGSGCVWDKRGHIVTNYHVIQNSDRIAVNFDAENEFEARIVGVDSTKDLAVISVDAPEALLIPAMAGEKRNLVVGRKVLALGNPFGLHRTLTIGIISALGREIQSTEHRTIRDVIQTDAAINPGNSGGPLLDSKARLIGINTAILSASGSSAGIGFAIPIHTVRRIVSELIKYGKVRRAGLGITTLSDNNSLLPDVKGVAVLKAPLGSPAEKAGLRGIWKDNTGRTMHGDVIVQMDDTSIRNNDELSHFLEHSSAGDTVSITVIRNETRIVIPFVLTQVQ